MPKPVPLLRRALVATGATICQTDLSAFPNSLAPPALKPRVPLARLPSRLRAQLALLENTVRELPALKLLAPKASTALQALNLLSSTLALLEPTTLALEAPLQLLASLALLEASVLRALLLSWPVQLATVALELTQCTHISTPAPPELTATKPQTTPALTAQLAHQAISALQHQFPKTMPSWHVLGGHWQQAGH